MIKDGERVVNRDSKSRGVLVRSDRCTWIKVEEGVYEPIFNENVLVIEGLYDSPLYTLLKED